MAGTAAIPTPPGSGALCSLLQEEQLGFYVLYSKNKPQADALLHGHGNIFFKVIPPPQEPSRPQPGRT